MFRRSVDQQHRKRLSARASRYVAAALAGLSLLASATGCGSSNPYSIASQRLGQARIASKAAAANLIVKVRASASSDSIAKTVGARTVSSFPQLGLVVLGLPGGTTASKAMASLAGNPAVAYAEPDYRMSTKVVSNDPGVSRMWGHKAIDVFGAWDYTRGDPRVVVAVVDTGIDLQHPDLKNQIVGSRTFVPGTTSAADDNGHGTHVAGVIAAESNNSVGVAGVAPACKLLGVKVLDAKGEGNTSDIVAGLLFAADSGARVINLSLGGGAGSKALEEAVRYAHGKGSLVVAAMGNDGRNVQEYPAAYAGVLSVGATTRDGNIADFSNFGSWISVAAPGDGVWSTMPMYESTLNETEGAGVGYGFLSGTSMATPYVAGVAALVASLYPNMQPASIRAHIERSADNLGTPGFDGFFGNGQVNARRAITGK